jgi:hypothetical protein
MPATSLEPPEKCANDWPLTEERLSRTCGLPCSTSIRRWVITYSQLTSTLCRLFTSITILLSTTNTLFFVCCICPDTELTRRLKFTAADWPRPLVTINPVHLLDKQAPTELFSPKLADSTQNGAFRNSLCFDWLSNPLLNYQKRELGCFLCNSQSWKW